VEQIPPDKAVVAINGHKKECPLSLSQVTFVEKVPCDMLFCFLYHLCIVNKSSIDSAGVLNSVKKSNKISLSLKFLSFKMQSKIF